MKTMILSLIFCIGIASAASPFCSAGYYLPSSTCQPCPTGFSSSGSSCTSALGGYAYISFNSSVIACPTNCQTCTLNPSTGTSHILNISTTSTATLMNSLSPSLICTAAASGYRIYSYQPYGANGYTITTIIPCPANCLSCQSSGETLTGSSPTATKCNANGCATGYYADSTQQCYLNPTNPGWVCGSSNTNAVCLAQTGAQCTGSGYFNGGTSTCTACSSNCLTCSSTTLCSSCIGGYGLSLAAASATNTCTQCSSVTANCMECSAQTNVATSSVAVVCTACAAGYVYLNNTCTACPANCLQCSVSGYCTACKSGYGISYNTGACASCNDTNCTNCDGIPTNLTSPANLPFSYCTTCATGFSNPNSNPTCLKCPFNCTNCLNSTFCLPNCTVGYSYYNSTGLCLCNF